MSSPAPVTCPSDVALTRGVEDVQTDATRLHLIHIFAATLCAVVFSVDLVEIALGPAFAAIFSAPPYRLGGAALTALLCAVYAGAIVGAPTLGWIADRRGLRTALVISTLWLAVSSAFAAMSISTTSLIVWRMLSGVALGGLPPLLIAYLTDLSPQHFRGRIIFFVCAAAYLAPPAAIFYLHAHATQAPFGLEAWRWTLLAASVICLATGALLLAAPEAPRWLAATGRTEELGRVTTRISQSRPIWAGSHSSRTQVPDSCATASGSTGPNLILLSAINFTLAAATVSFPLVTGPILLARDVNVADTLLYIGVANFGPVIATLLTGFVIDKLPRRSVMSICAALMLVAALAFVSNDTLVVAAGSLIAFSIATSLYMPTLTTFGAELFRPAVRARATSIAWLANRTAAVAVPAALIPLSRTGNVLWVGVALGVTLTANLALLLVSKTKTGLTKPGSNAREMATEVRS